MTHFAGKNMWQTNVEWKGLNLHTFHAQLCWPTQKSAHKITGAAWRTKILGFQSFLKLVKALVSCVLLYLQCNAWLLVLLGVLWVLQYYIAFGIIDYLGAHPKCPIGCPAHKNRRFHTGWQMSSTVSSMVDPCGNLIKMIYNPGGGGGGETLDVGAKNSVNYRTLEYKTQSTSYCTVQYNVYVWCNNSVVI